MSQRGKTWLGAVVLLVIGVLIAWLTYNGGTYKVEITQQEAQKRIDDGLEKRAEGENKNLQISALNVHFENGLITVDANVSDRVKTRIIHADIHAVGEPEYKSGSFYFHPTSPVEIANLKIETAAGAVRFFPKSRELIKQKAEKFVAAHGLEDLTQAFRSEFDEWVSVTVQQVIPPLLARYPLYTIKDTGKGFAIRAVLEKVAVVGDTLEVTLSLVQFGYTILFSLFLIVLAVALIALLFTFPELALLDIFIWK